MFPEPRYSYLILIIASISLLASYSISSSSPWILFVAALLGALPTFIEAAVTLKRDKNISIATFNSFAVVASLVTLEWRSAVFIILMLACARILDAKTEEKMHRAVEELIRLKPATSEREEGSRIVTVQTADIQKGDIVIIRTGSRIGVDGLVVFGSAFINESSVTGETLPKEKRIGDIVVSSSLNESGFIKIRATHVGKDSTIERIARLIEEASHNKSHTERTADVFARAFLPLIVLFGLSVYLVTHNVKMMAAIFLVACADDLAVAIPLAITASIGEAARRGVLVKGGEQFETLSKIDTLVLDKTGTLTLGSFGIDHSHIESSFNEDEFWSLVAAAEKYASHPIGRAIYTYASKKIAVDREPIEFGTFAQGGVSASVADSKVLIGNSKALDTLSISAARHASTALLKIAGAYRETTVAVLINDTYAGYIVVSDTPRPEARASISTLQKLGISSVIFTGDNSRIAHDVASQLGISRVHASMLPGDKVREVASLTKTHIVGMIGDGINDAPSLARAHVGIAMGGIGTAVATEAADAVILSDNLAKVPDMILLSRKTMSVVRGDIAIWLISNGIGFTLVLFGIAGPAGAAFYNFLTDFLPLINSARLFRSRA